MDSTPEEALEGVAIIGLSGRFPGAANVDEFWTNLRAGVESIRFFSDEELLAAGVPAEAIASPGYVKASGVLEGIELFDAPFFGFSPREAEIMDPQLRFFLEGSWEALENAGYNSEIYAGPIGVFGGMYMSKYLLTNLLPNRELTAATGALQMRIWNDKDFLASLVAYKMNLRGPSVTIQTACSTSLVAVCMACQSLLNYQCDMALAGGVTISVPHNAGAYAQEGVLSPDGHCRAFDAAAQGTVGGNGMGVVLLKRLADAMADGDTIYAVLKGWAINNDGSAKIGYTAPSVEGQMEVIGMAQALARVDPETVTYIETHGTGTPLGDPIEITALTEVFRAGTDRKGFCAIGSVKTNIGHLDAAAGVSSLIKTVQALRHKEIPPSLNFERPNSEIDFENSPFFVNSKLTEWKRNGAPRRAGVSSFAMGGVNAHVIVEEAPEIEESSASRPHQLLVLSARTNAALGNVTQNLAAHLRQHPELKLSDVAYTLQVGRKTFNHRRMLVCDGTEDAVSALETLDARRVFSSISDSRQRNVVFMFPGQGTQYVQMAAGLYADEPAFREQFDLCAELLSKRLDVDLRDLLYPVEEKADEAAELLSQTRYTQPALFAVEYALARVWMSWGIEPQLMIGHSVGEYVAACLAGVMTLEDALSLVAERARLMQQLPAGAMLAVSLSEAEVQPHLRQGLSLAAVNGPSMCVVSGLPEMVNALHARLSAQGVDSRLLHTSHAFHSEMVEPILQKFTERVKQVRLQPPAIPYISNLTGDLITEAEATDARYWAKHLRHTVRFADGLGVVLKDEQAVLIEVGPGRTLSTFCKQHSLLSSEHLVLSSVRHPRESQADMAFLLNSLGRLWLTGMNVDWSSFYGSEQRRRVALPTYPFERQRCWVEPPNAYTESAAQLAPDTRRLDLAEWFYTPLWKQSLVHQTVDTRARFNWLIFADEIGLGARVAEKLKQQGHEVALVKTGAAFSSVEAREFTIDPQRSEDYEALLSTLVAAGRQPQRILHLWTITSSASYRQSTLLAEFEWTQTLGSHSLLRLAEAVTKLQLADQVTIIGASNDLQAVIGDEQLSPEKATLIGACQAVAERGALVCRCVDVSLPAEEAQWEKLINRLCTEFVAEAGEKIVAYRGNRRWVPSFEQVTLDGASEERTRLRAGGVYFFAGNVTARATRLALSLAQNFDASIALLLDADFPPEELLELEAACDNKLLLLRAERKSDIAALENAFAQTIERFGEVHGVVYTVEPAGTSLEQNLSSLIALSEVLKNRKLDFCLLQSQLSALFGETVSASSAAAYFVKSLASQQSRTGSVPWISMEWDGWPTAAQVAGADEMTPAEALQVVARALSTDLVDLLVSPTSLQHRIQRRSAAEALTQPEPLETTPSRTLHQRLDLPVEYVAPRNEDEERLATIWKQFLGFEQIGVHDNFFDLGGHSLLATQLISRVRTSFDVTLPLETLFAAPTVAGFAEQIQEARREQEKRWQPAPIEPAPRDGILPLSFAQQRMWFLDQLESSSSTYNIPNVLRIGGAIDIAALELSLNEIVRRHEILRTTYAVVDEQPVQVIAPELEFAVSMIDVSDLLEFEREERAQQLVAAEVREPFSLATGPLMRVSLIRMKEEDHILILTLHHIVADGWSMGVLLRELEILYHAHTSGQAARLAELPIQYADFARWQRQSLQGEAYEAQLDYWKQQLADPPRALDLPADRPRPAKQTFNGAVKTFTIAPQTYQDLHTVNREEGATMFMALLATFQTLLHRYTGQDDIVVGSAIANRNRAELEGLIGFFVNTLALRTSLARDPSFRELLSRVREVALGAYAHQDVPFEQLVEVLQPVRDASRPPLFQTMLVLQNAPLRSQELSGLTFSSVPVDRAASMFDLTLYFTEMEDGLLATVEYNTDLFDEGTIDRLANHFEQLLGSIAANPDERLSRLSLLTPAEERRLIAEWNDTVHDYPRDRCLHQLFEQQVERTPHDTALICGERQISFAELNRRANQLARYLQRQGAGPETIVGLMIERSIEMVVGLFGVLKAGAAYVPLDPAYPQERLSFMLEDSEARVLVTQQHLIRTLGGMRGQQIVCIDDDWPRIVGESTENLDHSPGSNSVAYVVYTSGSTGQPKGVMGLHKGMVNRFQWMWERYPFEAGEVCCHKTSLSFLDSVWEIFGTLAHGVPVVIIPADVVKDVDQLVHTLAAEGITRIVLVPSLLRLMLDTYPDLQTRVPKLKIWVSSGEALSFELAQRFKVSMPQSVLLNLYGSSEASADSTWFDTSEGQLRGIVPIGRPITNTSVYILDSHQQLVPAGVPGELYIGGEGLARGYWKRASLTAEKFIPNPFGLEAGARLYRTGDLARFLPDGTIEYAGRVDHQIKIRGMRVELGEIETTLTQHPLVRQAVVIARQDFEAELQLVGYIVPVSEEAPAIGALRQFLRQRLPEHMVPAAFVLLDELPLTPNGKVNRRALPAPDHAARLQQDTPFASPETQTEIDVAQIWSEVLHGKEVGIDDNFFDLGGHSLLATQAASRLRKWFDVELPLRKLFDAPTVRELAQAIDSELGQKLQQRKWPELRARDRNEPVALSFAQRRLWFLDQLEPHSSFYNIPAAVRLKGRLDLAALEQSFAEVIRRHESLRTRFSIAGNEPVQLIDENGALALALIDLSRLPAAAREAEARRVAAAEAQAPFDLSVGPLVRARVLRLGAAEHVLLCTMHHIVSDGWSMGILIKEVTALYEAFAEGKPSPLPALPIQYADYAQWQREWLQGEVLERQLSYWKQQLAGAPAVLELPLDHARPAVQRYRGAQQTLVLGEQVTAGLQELSRREGVTLFMTLLAAWQTLLARYSGQEDVVVGTPIAGRNHAETEALIGFFINTLVLRTKLSGDPRFVELVGRVREVSLGAYANQDVPFEKLVEELQPERSLNHSPLFQVMFVLQNVPQEMRALPELELSAVDGVGVTSKFDLTLSLVDTGHGLVGTVGYNTDLFAGATIARMMRHFEVLLENVVRNPEQRLSHLEILSAAEREQIVAGWNETAAEYPAEKCIQELFAAQVERSPEAEAVLYKEERISYRELNERANRLAHYLQTLGVGPEVLVGLCVERSVQMVVGLLGILKAGGAYVPLDPSYPQERLAYMLTDARVSVLLTQAALLTALPPLEVQTFCLDSEWELTHDYSTANPSSSVTVNNLAYVIYTSGSTGRPKGVQVEHRGITNLALAQARAFQLSEASRVLQFASLSFDAAVSELFKTWLSGGTLCLASSRELLPGQGLVELLREQEITAVTLPPSVLGVLPAMELPLLKTIIAAGEACSAELAARWGAGRQFCNAYGPTETTVCATINATVVSDGRKPSIGKAMANMQVYILDAAMQPVPVGVSGELYVGGVGVARGYLNRSDLTAERFVPDPYGTAGTRLYRTGDLARFLDDGEIEYLGRIDNQVKVRGFRIELGEIEAALLSCAQVREAAVVALADKDGERRLVAYVVSEGEELSSNELSEYLASQLPQYMLPSAFVMLEQMPLTLSGKLDRRALPAPGAARRSLDVGFVAAETPLQQLLVDLWQQTLLVDQIGIHDNFFAIGGDSIRAAIFINKLQQLLGEYLYVVALFDAPTIAELAAYLELNYAHAVARLTGVTSLGSAVSEVAVVDAALLDQFRSLIPAARELPEGRTEKLARAVFILSAPRSGSTLLRVMLGGHPRLFAPPELELLGFTTLAERAEELSGRNAFWREGLLRALMQLWECDAERAKERAAEWEAQALSVGDCYGQLQEALDGARMLVDKTPSYALDVAVLRRAEELFAEPLYVHLVRDPRSMIGSFEEAKLDQVFFRPVHEFTRRQLAELIWVASEQNIAEFLSEVSSERQLLVRYEDLVREPQREAQRLSEFLGIELVAGMLDPYAEKGERMTDGIHPLSKMMGDVKFHDHKGIEASGAEKWRERPVGELWEGTWAVAARHGYEREASERQGILGALKKIERDGPLKLSYAQQRLWFLDQLEPHSSFYNIPAAVRLKGRLDLAALEQSFAEVIRRHESLRTRFSIAGNEPVQLIDENGVLALALIDLSKLPEAEREAEARRVAAAEAQAPFDLSVGPLVRARVLRLGAAEHVLLCTMHHIVSDGWSMGILIKEVTALYEAFAEGKPSPLPALSIQYADYAQWQREWLQGEVLERQLSYWKQQLAGAPAVLELPLDHARPAVQRYRGAQQTLVLGEQVTAGLKELSRREGVTLFMTLLAAWQTLLGRYSGQEDVVVGTPIAGRNHAETEGLIGFFINTLVLRTKLSGDPRFVELVGRVREVSLGAYANQDVPFEKLVEELQPERSLNHSPLFQVMFVLQNVPQEMRALPELELSAVDGVGVTSKFDLTLTITEDGATLKASFTYRNDLFEPNTIARMKEHYHNLLRAVVKDPESCLSELTMLSDAEREQLLSGWNQNRAEHLPVTSLGELFDIQAARTPDRVAISCEGEQLSFQELKSKANRLASYLRSRGVEREARIGICLERSTDIAVAVLGTLKAGAAYVPLDPMNPANRLRFMLADANACVVLTHNHLASMFADAAIDTFCIDTDWECTELFSDADLPSEVTADNLAYVCYTSGSTGQPKGVMIEHRSVLNLLQALNREVYGKHQGTNLRISMNGPLAFDTSVKQFIQLLNGHTLYVVPEEVRQEPRALIEFCKRNALDVLDCTPTMLEFLLMEGLLEEADGLPAVVLVGGEAIDQHTWELLAKSERIAFYNVYGPTECTVNATVSPVSKEQRRATIGRPIANVQVYILGRDLSPVAVGVRGEIYIGGEGVGRGYIGRPELTAERFVPDPYSDSPGSRMYKTGDQARYFADGQIDFIGRIDHQVKVRGYRIELAEIEAALEQHPSVAAAAVVVGQRSASDPQIVAYLVASDFSGMDHGLLRSFLADSLPHYMIPSSFVTLESLPLTPSGKLDRLALPDAPSVVSRPDRFSYNPDRPTQTAVAEVWAEVLGLDHVALDDNFFELGGHSLLATQAASRLRKWFDVELPLRKLFEAPTVRELAQVIDSELGQQLQQKWGQLRARDRNEPVALSYAQQRLWFLDQLEPGSDSYNIAAVLRMEGRLDEEALERALQEVVRRHESLRTRIELIGTQPYQVIDEEVDLRLPIIDHRDLAEQSKAAAGERVKREEASAGFNLSTGPLMRAKLIKQGAQDHLLLVTMHHIVSDGWSMGVLVKEVSALYEAYRRGEESPLAELPVQYADYALWQREWLQGEVLEQQLKYWEEKLAGAPVQVELPTDRPRAGGGRAGQWRVEFDEELTRSVKQESRKQGLTIYMLLMGVVGVLLTRYSRSPEVVIGSPIANRVVTEVEGLIGFFVNTLALRVRVNEEETVEELMKRVREEVLGAYAHQDVPYEKVVERVKVKRAGEAGELFQVMVAVQNAPTYVLNLPDLTLTRQEIETHNQKAKFDLLFLFHEEGPQIKGSVTYNSDLFDRNTINLMVGRFMNLLESAVSNMQQPVSNLSMLGEEESGGVTVEDFPEIGLDQQDLENLILELSES